MRRKSAPRERGASHFVTEPQKARGSRRLLDRGELPGLGPFSGRAAEGPHLGRLRRLRGVAGYDLAGRAIDEEIDQREAHRHSRIFVLALAPGLGEIALQQLHLRDAVDDSFFFGLALVVALAVLREGSEVALFLYGLLVSGESGADVILGGFSGLVLGAGVSALTYFGLVTIPARHLFAVTTAMITLLAAGLAAQCAAFLQQAWIVTALSQTMWDTSGVLPDTSLVGRVLHTLIGYVDQPTALQVVVYVATLAGIFLATRLAAPRPGAANVHAAAE